MKPYNDTEYAEHLSTAHRELIMAKYLSSEDRHGALTQCLAKAEDAIRKANWRLQELTPR